MPKTSKSFIAFTLVIAVLIAQIGTVFAAPVLQGESVSGMVTALTCEIDPISGDKTFLVTIQSTDGTSQTVHTLATLGLVPLTPDGSPDCSPEALANAIGMDVTIDSPDIIPVEEEDRHPVGDALATFFGDTINIDYDTIMHAHVEDGFGFGVIAQALWMTMKLDSDLDAFENSEKLFVAILQAKKDGSGTFMLGDGTEITYMNWGQFRKAVLNEDKKNNLGAVKSDKDKDNSNNGDNVNGQGDNNGKKQGNGNTNSNKNKNRENGPENSENKGNGVNK